MSIRDEYLAKHHKPLFAAWALAKDLMKGDRLRDGSEGYTAPNAALAAAEVFPEVTAAALLSRLNWTPEDGADMGEQRVRMFNPEPPDPDAAYDDEPAR